MQALVLLIIVAIAFGSFIILPLALSGTTPAPKVGEAAFSHRNFTKLPMSRRCQCVHRSLSEPNVRQLSNTIFTQAEDIDDPRGLNAMVWLWGQFIDHEITLVTTNPNDTVTIDVTGDPFFTSNITMQRLNVEVDTQGCPMPISDNTPFIDGTMIYGYSLEHIDELRANATVRGGLRMSQNHMLPLDPDSNGTAWLSGDPRVSEHAGLASIHTLWAREHNFWAERLAKARPSWTDDQLFWKARQFVITELQVITYEEYLPALFGLQAYQTFMQPQNAAYRPSAENPLTNEFSSAAYRMGHTQVTSTIGEHNLIDIFERVGVTMMKQHQSIDSLLQGALQTPAQKVDDKAVDAIRNFLFGPLGLDLIAMNIMRGREVSVADYAEAQNCLFGEVAETNGDLFIRMLQEPLMPESSLTPTLATLIADLFVRIRDRDRDFYLWPDRATELGSYYYNELTRTRLADIIERNTGVLALATANRENAFFIQ